jgi:hypothetical protein
MEASEIRDLIQQELPLMISNDPAIRDYVLRTVSSYYAGKQETESRFDQILNEIKKDREEQSRKWEESNRKLDEHIRESNRKWEESNRKLDEHIRESNRKWEESNRKLDEHMRESNRKWEESNKKLDEHMRESNRKWEESNKKLDEHMRESNRKWEESNKKLDEYMRESNLKWEESNRKLDEYMRESNQKWEESNKKLDEHMRESYHQSEEQRKLNQRIFIALDKLEQKFDRTLGALGARWGLKSEKSFRNALRAILEETFDVEVLNIIDYDETGEVFGEPDQIEIDILIKNGTTIACEIKSSISKPDVFIFLKKVEFYQKRHNRQVNRKIIISPMVDLRAKPLAEKLNIEIYSDASDIQN